MTTFENFIGGDPTWHFFLREAKLDPIKPEYLLRNSMDWGLFDHQIGCRLTVLRVALFLYIDKLG